MYYNMFLMHTSSAVHDLIGIRKNVGGSGSVINFFYCSVGNIGYYLVAAQVTSISTTQWRLDQPPYQLGFDEPSYECGVSSRLGNITAIEGLL